jgi:epsilon-lactone hydrolase
MPSPELHQIIALLRSRPVPERPTVASQRQGFEASMTMIPTPADVIREEITAGHRPAERLRAPGAERGRVVLYLHGGGYVIGSVKSHRSLAARIGRAARAEVLVLDYRLAPEHSFPAAIDDAIAAYRWLLDQGLSPKNLAIAGDSAGGGLAVAALLAIRDAKLPQPGAAVLLSPWVDLAGDGASMQSNAASDPMIQKEGLVAMARHYLHGTDPRHPMASPIYADLTGLPPMLVQVGTAETLLDDSVRLAARAEAGGVAVTLEKWDDMIHVWQAFASLPEAQRAVERIGEYLREKTALA